jgi:hypothetical protein
MNKISITVAFIIITVLFGSCKDWLYLEPENGTIKDEYWQSKQDVFGAVMGIYASMLSGTGSGSKSFAELSFEWGEIRADMVDQWTLLNYYSYVKNGDILPTQDIVKWNSFYRTINYCNTLLEEAPKVLELDKSFTQTELNHYCSEALAIRALMHFYLARVYDQIPIVTVATSSDQQTTKRAKSTRVMVFKQIESDLLEAYGKAVVNYPSIDENKGRITKYAIKTILADVYLWYEQYDKCIDACNFVINSGQFKLVERKEEWFSELYVNKNSSESIFELQYNKNIANPMYALCVLPGYYKANAATMEFIFESSSDTPPDSLDIRGDKGSYRAARSYVIWKYAGLSKIDSKTSSDIYFNYIVYRYAEVLLMKAEALAARNATPKDGQDALSLIKQIRYRAHATGSTDEGSPTDTKGLISYIVNERAREFAFEGRRWFDILRNAKRNHYERQDLIDDMVLRSAPPERMVTILSKYRDTLFHYFPIPQADIDAGYPDLVQNPYYSNK